MNDIMQNSSEAIGPPSPRDIDRPPGIIGALQCYFFTSLIAVLGVTAGFQLLKPGREIPYGEQSLVERFAAWDGGQYMHVANVGYQYDPETISNIAFFPFFPLLGRWLSVATGLPIAWSLLLISHFFLAGSFILLGKYAVERFPETPRLVTPVLLSFGLIPTSFYFRMAYTESMFFFLSVLVLYGISRKWPLILLALLVGTSTAVKALGICLALPLLMEIYSRQQSRTDILIQIAITLPLCAWGLVSFMLFQWDAFGEPLAFAKAQDNIHLRAAVPVTERFRSLLLLEPVWANYFPQSPSFWKNYSPAPLAWFNVQFANPIYWVAACITIFVGWKNRILNRYELAFSVPLLVIPYLTRGYEFCMGSQGRYAAVVFPMFLVWGHWLIRATPLFRGSLYAGSGFIMGMYAACFAAWYFFV